MFAGKTVLQREWVLKTYRRKLRHRTFGHRTFGHRQTERIAVLASENKKFSVFIPTPSWYD